MSPGSNANHRHIHITNCMTAEIRQIIIGVEIVHRYLLPMLLSLITISFWIIKLYIINCKFFKMYFNIHRYSMKFKKDKY